MRHGQTAGRVCHYDSARMAGTSDSEAGPDVAAWRSVCTAPRCICTNLRCISPTPSGASALPGTMRRQWENLTAHCATAAAVYRRRLPRPRRSAHNATAPPIHHQSDSRIVTGWPSVVLVDSGLVSLLRVSVLLSTITMSPFRSSASSSGACTGLAPS